MRPILIISGTNRPGSSARRIAQIIQSNYRSLDMPTDLLDLCDLPLEIFHPSAYETRPPAFEPIQQRILDAAGLHVITPEYNGSFPGVLKYFIDMLKFPQSLDRKPIALVGESNGAWGALRPVEQLQLVFAYRNAHIYPERIFIANIHKKLDSSGNLSDPEIIQRLQRQARGFARYATRVEGPELGGE